MAVGISVDDAQRALVVWCQRASDDKKSREALARWRLLSQEFGEGKDPFALP